MFADNELTIQSHAFFLLDNTSVFDFDSPIHRYYDNGKSSNNFVLHSVVEIDDGCIEASTAAVEMNTTSVLYASVD